MAIAIAIAVAIAGRSRGRNRRSDVTGSTDTTGIEESTAGLVRERRKQPQ